MTNSFSQHLRAAAAKAKQPFNFCRRQLRRFITLVFHASSIGREVGHLMSEVLISRKILLTGLFTAMICAGCSRSGIPAGEAKNHIGEQQTVYGLVAGTKLTRGGTVLLDIGAAYPNEQFTIVEFRGDRDYKEFLKMEGKTVSVTGTIKEYRRKPEIIITSPKEVSE